jgi:hypothetical protein
VTRNPISVVIVPVALAIEHEKPRIVGFRPGEAWLSRKHDGSREPLDIAFDLLQHSGLELVSNLALARESIEAVTFVEDNGSVDLVYTVALPVTAPLPGDTHPAAGEAANDEWSSLLPDLDPDLRASTPSAEWTQLVDHALTSLDPIARTVLEHWRQQVEETTAAMDLLPAYFTISQLRTVYAAIWGVEQDAGNFHRWAKTTNAGIFREVDEAQIVAVRNEKAHAVLDSTGWPVDATPRDIGVAIGGLVGTSPGLISGAALAVSPALRTVGAVVGGLVAYQSSVRARGARAQWHTRTSDDRTVLKELFAPRPIWQQAGIRAHPSGH